MKLSEKISNYRADRPDEWTMDEFHRHALKLEAALIDAMQGMRYIRESHGNLYGVGFDRVEENGVEALS